MRNISKEAKAELEQVRKRSRGVLLPRAVVDHARDEASALHRYFEWDDTEAAEQWRLEQARCVIRAVVILLPQATTEVRCYVSLQQDRGDASYRTTADVMSNDEWRARLLEEAHRDLEALERKYRTLEELAPVFEAAAKVRARRKEK